MPPSSSAAPTGGVVEAGAEITCEGITAADVIVPSAAITPPARHRGGRHG